jgi:hypothetical protein
VQPAGNHQVKREPEVVLYTNHNALSNTPQVTHDTAFYARDGRLRGPQQKGTAQPYSLKRLTHYA